MLRLCGHKTCSSIPIALSSHISQAPVFTATNMSVTAGSVLATPMYVTDMKTVLMVAMKMDVSMLLVG